MSLLHQPDLKQNAEKVKALMLDITMLYEH